MNKKGALLVNLGSPDSYDPKDVKRYLGEFLMDERVIDVPYLFRAFIVKGIILNTRPKKSAEAYEKIWWKEGSPLIVISERFAEKVASRVGVPVSLAMRYGSMSIKKGLQQLYNQGVREVLLVPLYPQFAMATTETILVLAEKLRKEFFPDMTFSKLPAFYAQKDYIEILAKSIQENLQQLEYDHIIFSYHGLPKSHIKKSDITQSHCKINDSCCVTASPAHEFCYRHQCFKTTQNIAEKLNLKSGTFTTTFQSRLGIDPWLTPFTDRTIEKLGLEGVKKLVVVTPAFVSDCIETLEEIAIQGKELFMEVGGEAFTLIPCLNDRDDWANLMSGWIDRWAIVDVETAIA